MRAIHTTRVTFTNLCRNHSQQKFAGSSMMDNTKDKLSAAGSSMRLLKKLKAKEDETSLFMSSFDPTVSRTAKLKKEKDNRKKKKGTDSKQDDLYDIKGILLRNGVNLCDCLDHKCPGCHFDCLKCGSGKCGHECRKKRTWEYDIVESQGQQLVRENPFKETN